MDWELSKENAVPVRQGRTTAALQELAAADPTETAGIGKHLLEEKRKELWKDVASYQGEDPLEPWQKYVKWVQEHCTSGGKGEILKVLEACTKELIKHERYKNDIRFLRIWIQYADCLPDPSDVFLYLKEQEIGRDFALYYEAYATHFELHGNYQSADAVYRDGVDRCAKPLERLKQKHAAFQQRMAQRIQRKIQEEVVMGPSEPAAAPMRSSLAPLATASGSTRTAQQRSGTAASSIFGAAGPGQQRGGLGFALGGGAMFSQAAPASENALPGAGSRQGGLHVRPDEDLENGSPGSNAQVQLPGYSSMPRGDARELKPYAVMRKENLGKAMPWTAAAALGGPGAAGLGAGPGRAAPFGAPSLEIFTDEEFQEERPVAAPVLGVLHALQGAHRPLEGGLVGTAFSQAGVQQPAMLSLLKAPQTALQGSGVGFGVSTASRPGLGQGVPAANLLQSYFAGQGAAAPAQPQLHTAPATGPASRPPPAPEFVTGPAHLADSWAAQQCAQEELSYEELRAQAWIRVASSKAGVASTASAAASKPSGPMGAAASATAPAQPSHAAPLQPRQPLQPADALMAASAALPYPTAPAAPVAKARSALGAILDPSAVPGPMPVPAAGPPLPHVATLLGQHQQPAGPSAPAALTAAKRQLADLSSMGGHSSLRAAAAMPNADQQVHLLTKQYHNQGPEPTITISTRNAFDAINSMFSDDLPSKAAKVMQSAPTMPAPAVQQQPPRRPPLGALPMPASEPPAASPDATHGAAQQQLLLQQGPPHGELQQMQQHAVQACLAPQAAVTAVPQTQQQHEPTVTIFTKQAFDDINGMFSTALPHEEARKGGRRASVVGGPKAVTSSDVCRLANMGRTTSLGLRTDSTSHNPMLLAQASSSSLAIYEDTIFLPDGTTSRSGRPQAAAPTAASHAGHAPGYAQVPEAFAMAPNQPAPAIYEDTEFLPRTRGLAVAGAVGGLQPQAAPASGGLQIYEDTEFIRPGGM